MADYSGNDYYYGSYHWEDGQWWMGKCFDENKWHGPFDALLAEVEKRQRGQLKNFGWASKGKIVKHGNEWKLTFPKGGVTSPPYS